MKTSLQNKEIEEIIKSGDRYTRNGLSVICKKRDIESTSGESRYAVVISKKTAKNSTERNRIRRVIREVVRRSDSNCKEFVILHTNKERDEKEIQKDLLHTLKRIKERHI